MRIAKNKTQIIEDAPTTRFMLVVDVMDGDVFLSRDERQLLTLSLGADGTVTATVLTDSGTYILKGDNAKGREVILTAGYARLGLYVDGVLTDEDFFLSPLDYRGATVYAGSFMHFEAGYEYHSMPESAIVEHVTNGDGYRPHGRDMSLRHPIPAVIRDRLHVFYLDARREGSVKHGMGAHRLCALFTEDGKAFHSAPIALPIDSMEEKSIIDASPLTVDGRTYLYYLVDYRGGRALSCAVSEDGFSYLKTGLDVEIPSQDNQAVDSVCASLYDGAPSLLYTAKGKAYIAKSIDLLHFEAPRRMPTLDGVLGLSLTYLFGKAVFTAEKDGKTVYAVGENDIWRPLPTDARSARPIAFGEEIWVFGTRGGALAVSRLDFSDRELVRKTK